MRTATDRLKENFNIDSADIVQRKDDGYIGRRMLRIELPGKRKRGRPKREFMDVMKEDMAEAEVMEEDREDRNNWGWKIRYGKRRRIR